MPARLIRFAEKIEEARDSTAKSLGHNEVNREVSGVREPRKTTICVDQSPSKICISLSNGAM